MTVAVGQVWKRNAPFKEQLEVKRVWGAPGDIYVRAHPVNGGKPIVCSPEWLEEECTREQDKAGRDAP